MGKASVVIVDDHCVVCAGLKLLIDAQPDMQVTAEFHSGKKALAELRSVSANLILLDLQLGDVSGLDVLRSVVLHTPGARVLMLSSYPEAQYALNVLRAGASGFLSKSADPGEMLRAMRAVMRGGRYVGATLAEQLVSGLNGDANAPLHGKLSAREFQIFCKLAQGESVSAISAKMFLSVKTVSTYRRRVLDKMSMKSNADLTSYAIRNELIQ
jgi:two-component system, NarL family, invasion response regulator UvrY